MSGVRIGVLFNVQHESLATALRALLPGADIISFDLEQVHRDVTWAPRIESALLGCDYIISQDVGPAYRELSTKSLRRAHRTVHLLPALRFGGFHPDSIGITLDGVGLGGACGASHSRIAVCGYLAGLDENATEDLFNRLIFHRLGYFREFAIQRQLLLEQYAAYGFDLTASFAAWQAGGCFMHAVNHPVMAVMLDLARIVCARLGLGAQMAQVQAGLIADPLSLCARPAVYPEIARGLGLPAGLPAHGTGGADPTISQAEFIRVSYQMFRRVPLQRLRAGDGVVAAMAALGLHEPARPASAPPTGDTVLLTDDGSVLRVEAATGMLLQRKLWPPSDDEADFRLKLPPGTLTKPIQTKLLGGVEVVPAATQGLVSLRRNAALLSARPGQMVATFAKAADDAGKSEIFLPLAHTTLTALRLILAHHWRVSGTDDALPRQTIATAPGFILRLDAQDFDLRHATFRVEAAEDGGAFVHITEPGHTVTLRRDVTADLAREFLGNAMGPPDEAASPEEFRAAPGRRLVLAARPELLHAPLVMSTDDHNWVQAALTAPDAPNLGEVSGEITLQRVRHASVLLSRGLEGVVITPAGVAKGFAALGDTPELPAGLRRDGGHLLIAESLLAEGPMVEGPICLPYGPDLGSYAGWVARALLNLHVMAAYLPPDTRLLLPGTLDELRKAKGGVDHLGSLATLGLTQLKLLDLPLPVCRAQDVTWVTDGPIGSLPATALRSFRDRAAQIRPPAAGRARRLYIKRRGARRVGNLQQVEGFLTYHGFETVRLEEMTPAEQIDLFAAASFVIAPHGGGLANLLFCAPGARVLEFSPDFAFRPQYWLMAEKLGLNYAVLPCQTYDGSFDGVLHVDPPRMRKLYRMLGLRE
jgi:hypothetical protein